MRSWIVEACALFLVAAGPADEAAELLDAGREREAFEMVERAAAVGDVEAVEFLGWFYREGRHVEQDLPRAADLYRRAAEAGDASAQWRLGVMLDLGEGIASDPAEAVAWFRKSASGDFAQAHVSLGVMYALGRGVGKDFAKSRESYLAAARRGAVHGFYGIAILHLRGEGVPADKVESLAWMLAAATLGDEEAKTAAEKYDLPEADTQRAADRGNAILQEFGYEGHRIEFENLDAEAAANAVA